MSKAIEAPKKPSGLLNPFSYEKCGPHSVSKPAGEKVNPNVFSFSNGAGSKGVK